jgi:hypothetical protein
MAVVMRRGLQVASAARGQAGFLNRLGNPEWHIGLTMPIDAAIHTPKKGEMSGSSRH